MLPGVLLLLSNLTWIQQNTVLASQTKRASRVRFRRRCIMCNHKRPFVKTFRSRQVVNVIIRSWRSGMSMSSAKEDPSSNARQYEDE